MATTQEFYRLSGRNPRYTTKLSAFANGMYLTNQIIPEGYAKAMVNYDIDDTGSNIKPRKGREKVQVLEFDSPLLGPVSLTDYVYAYNKDNTEVEDVKDIVLSYGDYNTIAHLINLDGFENMDAIYIASMNKQTDTNVYYLDENEEYQINQEGEITEEEFKEFWGLYYDKETESFKKIENEDIGYVNARTIKNAYAFDKAFKKPVGKPIGTILNNELITFAGPKIFYKEYTANPERNEIINFGTSNLSKLIITNTGEGYTVKRSPLEPRILNPIEAYTTGFNMLSPEPYVFEDTKGGSLSVTGGLFYDDAEDVTPVLAPRLGTPIKLRVYYQYPELEKTIKYKVEVVDLTRISSEFEVIENFDNSIKAGEKLFIDYTPKYEEFGLRITLRIEDDTTTDYPYYLSVRCSNQENNLENEVFDLSTCKGMISWQGCVGVYGVKDAPDTLFFSDVEDPSYFPYPYNILSFDNEILAVHNYLDHLIVVTVDSVWLVSAGDTINTSTQKRILANIHIPEIDAINLVVLKDQIFFKTDTQFYVLKPNQYTSDATDLKNYVNSTAIANYTQNFQKETVNILNRVYPLIWQDLTKKYNKQIRFEDFDVLDTRSIIRDEEVHYIYTILPKLTDGIELDNLNLHLVYNTISRSWRMYTCAIGDNDVHYAPVLYRNKQSGSFYEFFPHTKTNGESSALVVSKQTYNTMSDNLDHEDWNLTELYENYPYLDTGNISLDDTFTKRFREVQLNLLNMNSAMIKFYADFTLDGQERIHATRYEMNHITDVNDPEYGKIYVTPIEQANLDLAGTTACSDQITNADYWALDLSKFPDLNVATVRFQLQGRGRRGSLQLLNTSLRRYELSDVTWVYRIMNAR